MNQSSNTYLMDENVKISGDDMLRFPVGSVVNATKYFHKGTPDESLTKFAKDMDMVIVTKDIRMALRSLIDNVPVIYISDDYKCVSYLEVKVYNGKDHVVMRDYLHQRFGFDTEKV